MFKFAVRKTEEISRRILERNGLTAADLDLFVSHQANRRIIQAATEKLGVDDEKVIINIERFGNTTAATIPAGAQRRGLLGPAEEGRPRAARLGRRGLHGRGGARAVGILASRIFLLSPANCGGTRARQVLSPKAHFALAERLRSREGAPLGELFAFVSGLYFRGKLAYARRFAVPPDPATAIAHAGVQVITPNAGLRTPDTLVTCAAVRAFAGSEVHPGNAAYRRPLEQSARAPFAGTSAPTATSSCSAASPRQSTSTSCWTSSAIGCCSRSSSSAAAT